LYLALGRTPQTSAWSPAARAARALALASRGDDSATISARERAALAWDVLPVVYADSAAGQRAARADTPSSTPASRAPSLSLAELTLVTAAPATHVAASTRSAPAAVPLAPASHLADANATKGQPIDIDKVANDVYRAILVMMDTSRARNGEPY